MIAAVATLGCRGTEPSGFENVTLRARPGAVTQECVQGYTSLGLGDALVGRDGILHVPAAYHPATPAPLLVILHGAGSGASMWSTQAMRDLADPGGIIVLAVDSRSFSTWDLIEDGDYGRDVAFMDAALAWVFQRCNVDPARIALAGFSDGASEAIGLGLANGGLFAHVIAFSPGFFVSPIRRGSPQVFISHGTHDPVLSHDVTRDDLVPALRAFGHQVTFRSFEGGHEIPPAVAAEALARLAG